LAALWLLVGGLAWAAEFATPGQTRLPVLVYHHLADPAIDDVACTPAQFVGQMKALLAAGFTPLTLRQVRLFLTGGPLPGEKPVLITFDDGYESLYHHALPVAVALEMPMTVFLVTARLGRTPQFLRYLDEHQIREMNASGFFEFGSHTHDLHTDLLRIATAFPAGPNPVDETVRQDLLASRDILARLLGKPPFALAWPFGKYTPGLTRAARDAGFLLHFTSRFGYNEPGCDPFALKRIPVSRRDTPASVVRKAVGVMR
jgi:peptidoglycan/xylan/chitin deacetylase (PgdA/CDA1 family)